MLVVSDSVEPLVYLWWVRHATVTPPWVLAATTPAEQVRAERFDSPAWRTRFLTGRALVRSTLASRRGVALDEIVINRTCRYCGDLEHGKPTSAVTPALWWSLSRSDALSALAWSDQGDVGLDIASTGEPTPLGSITNWVAAEAALKLIGRGLADDPRTLRLSSGRVEMPEQPPVLLREVALPGSVGALATLEPMTVVLREVDQMSGVLF